MAEDKKILHGNMDGLRGISKLFVNDSSPRRFKCGNCWEDCFAEFDRLHYPEVSREVSTFSYCEGCDKETEFKYKISAIKVEIEIEEI